MHGMYDRAYLSDFSSQNGVIIEITEPAESSKNTSRMLNPKDGPFGKQKSEAIAVSENYTDN